MPGSINRPRPAGGKYCAIMVLGLVIILSAGFYYCYGKRPPDKLHIIMHASPGAAAPEASQLSQWIRGLISPDKATRKNARKRLIAANDAALPALKKSFSGLTTPPLRRRLRSIRAAIARADALRGPMVTLNLHHATLRQVIDRLCIPMGIHPEFYPPFATGAPVPPIFDHQYLSVDVDHQPFWTVVRKLAHVTGISPGPGFSGQSLYFGASGRFGGTLNSNPVDESGPFLFVLECPGEHWGGRKPAAKPRAKNSSPGVFLRHRAMGFVEPDIEPNPQQIQLGLDMLWCPAGNRLSYLGYLQHLQAMDSAGKSILLFKKALQQQFSQWNQDRQMEFTGSLVLKRPGAGIKTIAMIRGSVPIVMSFDPLTRQINNLASGKASLDISGLHFKFGKPTPAPAVPAIPSVQTWTVSLTIRANMIDQRSAKLLAWFLHSLHNNDEQVVMFRSATGEYHGSPPISRDSDLGACYRYSFEIDGPAPVSARVRIYRQRSIKLSVPFEFRNVPVPQ